MRYFVAAVAVVCAFATAAALTGCADVPPTGPPADLVTVASTLTEADDADPLMRAIAEATSVRSDAGFQVRDSEWYPLWLAMEASQLSPEAFREVADRLFVLAPCLGTRGCVPPLPASAYRFDADFADDAPTTAEGYAEIAADTVLAEPVLLYTLPDAMRYPARGVIVDASAGGDAVLALFAEARRDAEGALVAVDVTVVTSDCGWCQQGQQVTLSRDGAVLARTWPGRYAAFGYCC